ncbi:MULTISPECIES: hypothetical protein [Lysinibacillus]|uniref:hypothetical protein n=1 Tax=Lysinibacillus TaxID=400634 RepID=UPI00214BED67|nr:MULTISPECIES: hypothetical protein [Lysinibacillus]UUV25923.1 hypothetical protein NP781_04705 [Lysinibacillus sp. FN11]UYB48796.1 hypothetical protein OCI51_07495 [Lysinibacillus capsici]
MLKVDQKVKVNIGDFATNGMGIDEKIQGATGVISEINSFIFPYIVKLDDPNLNKLITDTPRQFSALELEVL